MKRRTIFLSLACLAMACGTCRASVARDRYLSQMLFDYAYPQPLEVVWPEAMAVIHQGPDAGIAQPWGRSFGEAPSTDAQGQPYTSGMTVEARATDAGTVLRVYRFTIQSSLSGENRDFDAELQIMRRLQPQMADRLSQGAARAAARER